MNTQRGFTLIELIVVIVVLGILAAIAVPKFVDLSIDSHNAAAKGVASGISSGTATNLGARLLGTAGNVQVNSATVCTIGVLQQFVSGVTLTAAAPATDNEFQVGVSGALPQTCAAAAVSVTCNITPRGTGVTPAQAIVMCAR